MSKAILKFDLSNPDDMTEFKRVNKATDMTIALFDITSNTRKSLEYEIENKLNKSRELGGEEFTHYDVLYLVFDKIYEILDERNININDILD